MLQSLQSGQGLNDNQWHTVSFSRRANNLNLQVDDEAPVRGKILGCETIITVKFNIKT